MYSFKIYSQFVKPYWKLVVITMLIGVVKFGIPLTLPLVMKYSVDSILLAEISNSQKLLKLGYVVAAAFVLFIIIRFPVEYFRQYYAQEITSRILYDIRDRLYDHLQKLSLRFYQNNKTGEVISRVMNDVEQTKNIVETGMMNIWLDIFTLTIALGFMFTLNTKLTLVAIAILPLYAISVRILYKRLKRLTKERSQSLADVQSYLHERVSGMPVVKSFTLEEYDQGQFDRRNRKFLAKALAATRWNALTNSVVNTLTDIAPLLVIAYGGYKVITGEVTLGTFVAFFGYLDRIYSPLRRLVNSSTLLTQASASLERVMELWNHPYDITDHPSAKIISKVDGEIQFQDVWFRYDQDANYILKDINLVIHPGSTVALVGMSGGGKSSLISLIPRFYNIEKGRISIDGININDFTQRSLRSHIGMVLQDNILFSGTIRENILLGNPSAVEDEVVSAARAANAHDFILSLHNGYDTEIGEKGVKLSGGQKQRIAIARVFLKNPKILILDEATSALDLESEALIQDSLDRLAKNRTTIVIAHRLSTITHVDKIIFMKDGKVAEQGTHGELMGKNGLYEQLFNIQNLSKEQGVAH
ncbi:MULTISPECIES: ABC transporter ATP-binding protein [Mesobacillus]|uniref:Multidrug ABC transporter ATP-binding protein n=1 Tax=Mesobacillus subterraneus TaxID=285983 RepID=A0A0D6ZEZ8_9BACI|nr:ABC transporter ATP-binding protein [Mesobacillus subterraneus]KIY23676.1 multidrug ABC transporter ATP-binding protein [Mesobacillus subterraneus]